MQMLKQHSNHKSLHYILLAICLFVLAATFTAAYIDPVFSYVTNQSPGQFGMCIFKNATGYDCPGCGLTRSFLCIARGDFTSSYHFHELGFIVFIYLCLETVMQAGHLIPGPVKYVSSAGKLLAWTGIFLLLALLIRWVFKLV